MIDKHLPKMTMKKHTSYSIMKKLKIPKKLIQTGQKAQEKREEGAVPEESYIHKAKMAVINITMKKINKREDKIWVIYNIYRLSELYAVHQIQQRKSPDIKLEMQHFSRSPIPR